MAAVPLYVVKALAIVQESGRTNMIDREEVQKCVEDDNNYRALEWLQKAGNSEYWDALNEMGEYISVPAEKPYDTSPNPPFFNPTTGRFEYPEE